MYLGPQPGFQGEGMRRVSRRGNYEEVRRFRNARAFHTWWDGAEERNWRINSRHPHTRGTVEYWRCAFLQGRRYLCSARLRVTIALDNSLVIVARSRDHPHNHQVVRLPDDPNLVRTATVLEPFPVQQAVAVHIPRPGLRPIIVQPQAATTQAPTTAAAEAASSSQAPAPTQPKPPQQSNDRGKDGGGTSK